MNGPSKQRWSFSPTIQIGSRCDYPELKLAGLRFYPVEKPFHRHLIYYRISGDDLVAFRVVRESAISRGDCLIRREPSNDD
jgi:hypothetical protein